MTHDDLSERHVASIDALIEDGERRLQDENPLVAHMTDRVTGLFNEAYTRMKLADEFKRTRRFHEPLSLILVGADQSMGPEQDERFLVDIAGIFLLESRDIDHLARISDTEALMILPHTDGDGGVVMARRILDSVRGRGLGEDEDHPRTACGAVVCFEGAGAEAPENLLERAREALDHARTLGGGGLARWSQDGVAEA